MKKFENTKIVLTGASRGVGFEASKLFLKAGAQVIGTGRDEKRLAATAKELEKLGNFVPFCADFDDNKSPEKLANFVSSKWNSLDILINNAAVQTWKPSWFDEGMGLLEAQWRGNVFAPHELIYKLVPLLEKGKEPRIINVSSGAGTFESLKTSPDMPTYRLTKYAIGGITLLWAAQLKGKVAVNALDPGWLKTDLGGPNAPGEPEDGGKRTWEICSLPWTETGKFFHGDKEISF